MFIYLFLTGSSTVPFSLPSPARYLGGRDLVSIGQKESVWKCALTSAINLKLDLHRNEPCFSPEILFF